MPLIHFSGHHRALEFADRHRHLDLARAGHGAVVHGVAARQAAGLADDLQALGGGLIAAVEDEAVRGDQRGRAEVIVAAPERRAGGGAAGAQDALGGVIEALALLGALQAFLAIRGQRDYR